MQMNSMQLTYWQEHLENAPVMLTLPIDKQRVAGATPQTAVYYATLPVDIVPAETAVLHLLAVYTLLLLRHSQQDDIVVGTAVANRLLPLHTKIEPETTFAQLVAQIAQAHQQAKHNLLPLSVLVEELQPAHDDSYAPLFQVAFAAGELPETAYASLYDLSLLVSREQDGWHCCWHYRADLFTEQHIQQFATHFATLARAAAECADCPVMDLEMMPAAERELLLHTWNQTALDVPQDLCLHEWISQQAARTPQGTAVSDPTSQLTYAQLDQQSGQLAAYLRQQGVEPGVVVAFYLERTAKVLVTLLGILKAGGTYLPLTAALPAERIQFMLQDARARLLLTESHLAQDLPNQVPLLELDSHWSEITSLEPLAETHYPPEATAYIIYTSGSTGLPKGVPITHRNIVNLTASMLQEPGMTAGDKFLAVTALSFDILGYELYSPLVVGGEVVMAPEKMTRDGHLLSERLAEGDITFLQGTPVTWQMLLAAGWPGTPGLKMISCGEALTRHLATQLLARGAALWNLYGPTEATIFATGHRVLPEEIEHLKRDDLPIGRPVHNMQAYILDNERRLLPVGAVGELYLGGAGLSRGYLYRDDLTAERFVPHPFSRDPQAKLYRTGDLARYRPDGVIEYLGRTDYQVKLHGFRIELGEIESRLEELAEVQTAVAIVWTNPANNDRQLVAYFVSASGEAVDTNQIRQALKQTLPSYMVPGILMQLPQLPATPNGKVDRKALPAPNLDEMVRTAPLALPRNTTEAQLCAIWQSLLGISTVGVHDDFLELGAHSLSATQLVTRLQEQFSVRLSLRDIFEQGTVARIAALIAESQPETEIPPIAPLDRSRPLPVSFAQQRLLVIDQLTPDEATYNEHLALRLDGRLDEVALQTAVDALFVRHEALRTSFYYGDDNQPYQRIATEAHLPITPLDFSQTPQATREQEALDWLEGEMARPFCLTEDRLIRVSLLRLAEQQHILLILIHHIITDGWSLEILLEELWQLYRAAQQNEPSNLPALNVQYADFALWQRQWLQGEKLEQQVAYWQDHLAGAPPLHNLPTDLPRRKLQSTHGNVHIAAISSELTQSLRQFSRQQNATLFMSLFAAYNVLLFRHSQQADIVVGTASANRNHPQIDNLIGFFVNMLPLRTHIPQEASFLAFLEQVRQSTLDAQSYQEVPFEKVVDILQPTRDPSYSPVFQIAFTLENQLPMPQLEELQVTPLAVNNHTAKYDLTLFVTEAGNGLVCTWEYNTDLFFPETIARLHSHFATLLQAVVQTPELAVTQLPLLPPAEKQQLLHEWQGKADETIPHLCLHQQFEQWAEKQPNVTAVSGENLSLTYQELNQRANQLARLLIQHGVQPGRPVAIHMPGSVPAIIAILACHKARAAYIPFDPAYPAQRLQFMLDDAAAAVIVTDSPLDHLETHRCTVLEWEAIQPELDNQAKGNLDLAYTPADPAYIIYTSGSTGQPKGVVLGHTGVTNLHRTFEQWGSLEPGMAASLWTSLNFDVSVYEIFTPLLSGSTLHIVPPEIRPDAPQFFAWLAEQRIHSTYLPPFMVEPFLQWLQAGHQVNHLRRLLTGVEPLAEATLVAIQRHVPGLVLINGYGPTEATVCSTLYPVPPDSTRSGNAPIGRPTLNTQVYLLDAHQRPVPVGVVGELYIGGWGLAHGYLNRPELTAERFVPDPFSHDPAARLYRTGDLARYLPDGNLMFLGRTDFQVKVRGFRVELGEIEAHLLAQPGVASGVVLPHTAADGQTVLVAYFVPEAENPASSQTLCDALNRLLPNYMVPAVWIQLEEMPRTPNDKIDRKALPAPNPDELQRTTPFTPPSTATETALHAIWQSLLEVENISVHDSFFQLGGHSLLATQLAFRIQKQFDIQFPLRAIFEQSTIAQIARLIDEAQAQQLEEPDRPAGKISHQPIPKLPDDQPLPLSFAQRRLLVLDELDPNRATYNIPLAFQIDGRLDEEAVQTAVNTLYSRHDSLRTTFYYGDDGQPYQHIADETHLPIEQVDFSTLPLEAREKEVAAWVQDEAKRPFSLTHDRLIRVSLLRLDQEQHVLVIVIHHIITDGWSMMIFMREFFSLYESLVKGLPSNLPQLRVQYTDFAAWQPTWLQGDVLQQQLTFWQSHLEGAPAVLSLPTDFPRPKVQSTRGNNYSRPLPGRLVTELAKLSQSHNSTLFMTLLAAYNVLLMRHTQQNDLVVGTPTANRNHPDIENMIGFFVNMLPLRTQIGREESFASLLDKVRQTALEAYDHQDVPFEQMVNLLQPERETSHSPVFQVAFSLENASPPPPPLGDLAFTPLTAVSQTAKYDLTLTVTETADGLLCNWEYGSDLFLPETIERMHAHFETLLQGVVSDPNRPVQHLPLLSASEKQLLLHEWQGPIDATIPQIGLHQQFEQWAVQQPDAIAVADEHHTLTYEQLNQRANQLARLLMQQGVRPGAAIGIHMHSSVPAVIIILACHKARAAYVPFDPAYPTQRLQFMLDDTAAPVVITDSNLDHLNTGNCAVWQWEALQPEMDQQPAGNLDLDHDPADPAYIIYTSGSTGQPKGVVVGHTGVFNLARAFDRWRVLEPQTPFSLWTSLNFDASVYEIFTAFLSGGTLHVVPLEIRPDPQPLFEWLAAQRIGGAYLPPFMIEPFLQWLQAGHRANHLQRIMTGVEPLAEQMLVEIQRYVPGLALINAYGPTEASVCSTYYLVPPDSTRSGNAPIGIPLTNFQVYLLDEARQPVPIGVTGELYVGGIGLAQGYLNRPDLTAERFVPHPFSDDPAARLYRTGDLARYLPDGNLMFLGRTDFQVKVRGFRIELGEIEAHLLAQPGVTAGVVMPHTAADGQTTLVAYYTVEDGAAVSQAALREALKERLPNYMVPAVWIKLEAMPRTPNDKIDRKALPVPNLDEIGRATEYTPAGTPLEAQLVALWQALLKVEQIGIHDNFFSLGGHSLLATQLVTRIQRDFGVKLPLRDIFDHSTIAQIAWRLETAGVLPHPQPDTPSARGQQIPSLRGEQPPLSFAQQRLLVIDQLDPNQATYNVPLALRIDGRLDETALQTAVDALYDRHGSLRTTFPLTEDGRPYQHIAAATSAHFPINQVDLTRLPAEDREQEASSWIEVEVARPFNLSSGPLVRLSHLRLAEEQHILVIVMHHIITDGWSMDIFVRELVQLYRALVQDRPATLPELPIQYADFAAWQQQWLQGDELERQLVYWQQHLEGAPAVLALPTDRPRPKLQSTHGNTYTQSLPVRLSAALAQLSQTHNSTLFMTLLAAYNVLLARHSRQQDIVVGTPIANRNYPEIESLIGFFVNMLPLRTQLDPAASFAALLAQVRQTTLGAYTHQDFPFEQIVNSLQPERDTSHSPIFQVAFSLENASTALPQFEDSSLTLLKAENKTAKYDLTLSVAESDAGLVCTWEYNTDLFLPETIERMHAHFETLLQGVVSDPNRPVQHLPLLSASEKQLLLREWQGPTDTTVPQIGLHQQVEQWAAQQPQAIAVSDEHHSLTYEQLNQRANQLARLLVQQGVRPGAAIGIHMHSSVPAVIIILACHKARAAYVPFDPAYPTQRLQFMLDDTAAPVVITDSNLDHLNTGNCAVWQWSALQPQLDQQPDHNLDLPHDPADPAYIIYTSGSTGQPKGVVLGHSGVTNLHRAFEQWGSLEPGMAASLWTSLNFDVSVYEIFVPLLSGSTLHIVPPEIRPDAPQFFAWLAAQRIHSTYLPPFMVEPFLHWLQAGHTAPPLKRLLVGVEPLAEQTLVQIQRYVPGLTVINAYGPTEATVSCTYYRVPPDSTRNGNAPIGRPLTNYQVYLLDEALQPVPIGAIGELYVGGLGLAQGYLNRPDLSTERFVPHPFSNDPAARLYRTGDLARYLPDGNLMFLGRTDFQVKVRGFRVELGEIESHLLAQPGVASGAVLPYTAADGQTMLVAYYTLETGTAVDQAMLREALKERLPNYMVPAVWIQLEAMPRTPSDKIDRKALPAPNPDELQRTIPYTPPRTPLEKQLVALWERLLHVEGIGIHANFFELGGHSLLAVQLITTLRQQLDMDVPLRLLFDAPTIAELAHHLENRPGAENDTLVAERPLANASHTPETMARTFPDDKLPLSLAQKRLWFFYKLNPQSAAYNVPIALRLRGDINPQWLQQSLLDVIARHEVLRTIFYETDDVYGRAPTVEQLPLRYVDLSNMPVEQHETEVMKRVKDEVQRPFTLTEEIPVRIQLLELADDYFVLLLTLHHIAIDLWSIDLLVHEVVTIYRAYQEDQVPDLPELRIQYGDYAAWQQRWLAENQDQQLAYWQQTLAPDPDPLMLPTDKPRPAEQTDAGADFAFQLPDALGRQVFQFSHQEKATLFMVLLAAYHALLSRYTHQSEINVGSPIANRHHMHTENLLGFFVNTVVINASLTPEMSFRQLLRQVRQRTLGAQENQDIPFNKLVEAIQSRRNPAYSPLFQTLFSAQTASAPPTIPGVKLEPISFDVQTAKFDLTLSLTAQDERLFGQIEYNIDLFSAARIEQLSQHYVTLLEQLLQHPDLPLAQFDLRTEAERLQQAQAATTVSPATTVMERFAEIVAQFGDKTAVSTPTTTVTYQQLHQESNQVAHLLQQHNIQPGEVVAIQASPTPQMLAAVLGVLKAGGIYLPLNEDEPAKWQQKALQCGQAKLLLYSQASPPAAGLACPSLAWETAAQLPKSDLPGRYPEGGIHLPYLGTYRAAELQQLAEIYPIQATNQVLQYAPFASHQATHEIFATLLNGGRLHLAARDQVTKLPDIYDLLKNQQIDFAILPAALIAALEPSRVPHLQTVVSLEADMSPALWQKWTGRQRLHGYISAATILPAVLSPAEATNEWLTGTPINAATVQDALGRPVATGIIGELQAGPNLVPTGDEWRWLEDGRLQFRQYHPLHTTTRGRYVDTTWVAEALSQHPLIQECVVLPDDAPCQKRQLHAYVVTRRPLDTKQLTQIAQQHLPSQFIPAQFHTLDAIPVTAAGSTDYSAMQAMQQKEAQSDKETDTRAARQAQLAARRENLSTAKQALLAKWQGKKITEENDTPRISRREADRPLPLSFAQQRLWFIEQINPQASATYHIPIHLELRGALDVDALEHSFNQLLQRHESLRTRFVPDEDETPYQEVMPFTAVSLPYTDLSALPAADKEAKAQEIRRQNALAPFDLQNGPIYHLHLLRLDEEVHQLLFTIHHIAFDAWSTGLFLREIVIHYMQKTAGQVLPLPPVNAQYGDFTLWQQERLTPEVLANQLAFWRERLAHVPTTLALPTDKPRPPWQTSHGDIHDFTIPATLAEKVKQWAQAEQATMFVTLLTAFYGLLYRYTNQEEIVVGTPIANRNHPDLKNMIGFFLNTLALPAHLAETMTWRELLQQTHQTMLAAHAHQEYPFENLVQSLLPHRDPSRHPLFQVMFVLQNQGEDTSLPPELPLKISPIDTPTRTSKFDLLLHVQETAADFVAGIEYDTDLFNPSTVQRMAHHFQQMVAAMVTDPDQPIAQAQLLTAQEQQQIESWNDTAVAINPHQLVHHRFEQQVEKTPTAVAVLFGDDQLTYAQLEARANQLAHYLQAQGVQPGDRVGIMLPRSLAMVTAVLAALKAGAGYVPLDPDYPADRLQLMLNHADVKLLLTHSSLSPQGIGCSISHVDELDLSAFTVKRVTAVIHPEQPVYIIFTSGSTGTPKGVVLPHRALNNVLAWQQRATTLPRPARTLQFTSLSFDVHFQEMFSTWQDGGTLVLIPDDVRRDGEQLLAYLQKQRIERLFLPFVALHNLAEAAQWLDQYPRTLQEVITAGEALQTTPPIRHFFKQLPHCVLHNQYGPSESHVVTQYTLGPDPDQWPDLPPIGTPVDNTQIHLLDSGLRPVPIGVPGELYISGHNLALGYFNQPELTAKRFISLPVTGDRPSLTVYRTGDLARYLPDGNIQYLGRNDFQVKIRGHRVELGEIETVLNEQPAVQQAVVQAVKPDQGLHQLVAYVKTEDDTAVATLPAILREKLPAYMVPAHFIRLEQFPLTPSGKINRRALPLPDQAEVLRATPFVAPETDLHKQLVEIWERVLGVSPIGIHDNFFELGGHSLLAVRLVAAMHKATAVKVPLPRLFQEGTVAALANYISNPTTPVQLSPVVRLRAGDQEQAPLIVVHPGSGQVLPYLKLVNALPADRPVYGLQSMGLLPETAAQTTIEAMATTYLQALAEAEIALPYHLLGWSMGGVVALEMAQQLAAAGNPPRSLMLIDAFAPTGRPAEIDEATLLQWFAQDSGYLTPALQPTLLPNGASLEAQLRHLWPQLQAAGNLPAGLTLSDLEQQFVVFRANYTAMQAYRPQKYRLPVTLIAAKASAKSAGDKWLGWKPYLDKRSVQVLPGTHFSLLQESKTIHRIAQELMQLLSVRARVR